MKHLTKVGLVLLTGLCAASVSAKTLTFGTAATYPPYEFINDNNEVDGFDIDLAKALCKEMQVDCKFHNQGFESLIPSLRFKKFDAVIAGMDMTPVRMKQVDFTQSYYDGLSAVVVIHKGAFHSFADLKGQKLGVENGTTHQRFLQDKHPEIGVNMYDTYLNAFVDFKNNRTAGVFGDIAAVKDWLKQNPDYAIMDERAKDPAYYGEGLGIAVRKGDTKLLKELNTALDKFKTTPEYEQLQQKWFF